MGKRQVGSSSRSRERGMARGDVVEVAPSEGNSSAAIEKGGVSLERVIIEVGCVMVVFVLGVAAVNLFSLSPLLSSWRSSSAASNANWFVAFAVGAYSAFRLYFWVSYALLARINAALAAFPHQKTLVSRSFVVLISTAGLLILSFCVPQSKVALYKQFMDSLGELPEILGESYDAEYKRVTERAWKMGGLFAGWFLFFLVFETLIRAVLMALAALIRAVLAGLSPKATGVLRKREGESPLEPGGVSDSSRQESDN